MVMHRACRPAGAARGVLLPGRMGTILSRRTRAEIVDAAPDDPNPLWALAVGLVYLFRTRPGLRILRDLEAAIRRYAADPAALWRLVREGEEVIDTTATSARELPGR